MRCPQVQKNVENKTKLGLLPLRILHTVKNTFYQIFFTDNLADFHFYFRKLLHVSTHLIQKKILKRSQQFEDFSHKSSAATTRIQK